MTASARTFTAGDYVIVRASAAGVHAGRYVRHAGSEVTLTDARRLWHWRAASGAFLSGVAVYGLGDGSKIGAPQKLITILDACEISLCTDEAAESIAAYPTYSP